MIDAIIRLPDKLFPDHRHFRPVSLSSPRTGMAGMEATRERMKEILFIDASKMGTMASRKLRVFDEKDIQRNCTDLPPVA